MLILVTGGSRSGKSGFALETARRFEGRRVFLATAQASDEEMKRRIRVRFAVRLDELTGFALKSRPGAIWIIRRVLLY